MSELKNPMRFSIRHRSIDIKQYDVNVTELEIRPGEGQIYVHWEEERPELPKGVLKGIKDIEEGNLAGPEELEAALKNDGETDE